MVGIREVPANSDAYSATDVLYVHSGYSEEAVQRQVGGYSCGGGAKQDIMKAGCIPTNVAYGGWAALGGWGAGGRDEGLPGGLGARGAGRGGAWQECWAPGTVLGAWRPMPTPLPAPPTHQPPPGYAINGPAYAGIGPAVHLSVSSSREPGLGRSTKFTGRVTVRGLTPGKAYVLHQVTDLAGVPTSATGAISGGTATPFTAAATEQAFDVAFQSGDPAYYIAKEA